MHIQLLAEVLQNQPVVPTKKIKAVGALQCAL